MTTLRQSARVQEAQRTLNAGIQKYGAPCDGYTEEFYAEPDNRLSLRMAKFICDTCPLVRDCLDYALLAEEEYGVWGGMTAEERRWILDTDKRARRREKYQNGKENPRN
jgi:WhiB family redox-sensing transcriptional regulator